VRKSTRSFNATSGFSRDDGEAGSHVPPPNGALSVLAVTVPLDSDQPGSAQLGLASRYVKSDGRIPMADLRLLCSRLYSGPCARAASLIALATLLVACDQGGINVRGFVLPEGDPVRGEATFVEMGCTRCHTVANTELSQPENPPYSVALGGKVIQVKHYGDLLTSIVYPDHRVWPRYAQESADKEEVSSPMPDFTATLTVEQLIDLVAFLHGKYEKLPNYGGKYYYYP
jgi:hypothetical protein